MLVQNNNIELFCSDKMQNKFQRFMSTDYVKHHDLKIEEIDSGVICPPELADGRKSFEDRAYGGVCYSDLSFCELSCPKRFSGDSPIVTVQWFIGANPNLKKSDIGYVDEEVFFGGVLKNNIGHFMIENFSVMWPFLNRVDPKLKVVCLLQGQEEPKQDVLRTFYSALGLNEESVIFLKEPTRFKKVIVAEQSMELQGRYHPIFKQLFDKVKLCAKPAKYKKIYFSKRITSSWTAESFGLSRHLGEEIAEPLFKKNGFYIVKPEKISMHECISLLNGCEVFAASSSSNAHHAFLLDDETRCFIFNRSPHVHPHQLMIDEMRKLRTTYVDSCAQSLPVHWSQGPFIFMFTKYLKAFMDKYNFKYNEQLLISQTHDLFWEFTASWAHAVSEDSVYRQCEELAHIDETNLLQLCEEFKKPLAKKSLFSFFRK
jgi:hypothetical protein